MRCTKRGIPPQEEIWRGTCRSCKSEYEATKKEIADKIVFSKTIRDYAKEICEICGENFFLYPIK
jgi:hypothetical protein